jgi:hypothetical protein
MIDLVFLVIITERRKTMHLYDTLRGEAARQYCETSLKMDPAVWDLDAVNRIEIFGTDVDDPGEDYCEYRVIDCHDKLMAVRREAGY